MINHEYYELFNQSSTKKEIDMSYGSKHITNSDIVSGTFTLNESAFATKELRFGSLVASEMSVKLFNTVPNLMGKELDVSIVVNEIASNPLKIGKFKVNYEKPTTDRLYKQIKAYDALYEVINKDVTEWYESLTFPITLRTFRNSFCFHVGLSQISTNLINDSMPIEKTILSNSISGQQVLSAICELNGAIGRMNRDGYFEYVILEPNPYSRVVINKIQSKSGGYEDFECQPISKVQIKQTTDDIGAIVGEDGNTYIVQDNFLVYGKSASDLNTIATNLLSVIKGITYKPFNIKAIYGNPCLEIGDAVFIQTKNGNITSYIFNRTLKGIQAMSDTIKADGVEYYTENLNSANVQVQQLKKQTNELSRTVEETKSTVTSVEKVADEASKTAQAALGNVAISNTAQGNSIYVEDSGNFPLIEFYAYGKSSQDGEPTPSIPISITSVADDGNLVVTTTNNNTLSSIATIPFTDSLRGIKVTEGGNYIDETGQQWICDTIEKYADGTGKLVSRVDSHTVTVNDFDSVSNDYLQYGAMCLLKLSGIKLINNQAVIITNKAKGVSYDDRVANPDIYRIYADRSTIATVRYPSSVGTITLEQAKSDLVGAELVYVRETIVETDLSAEQMAEIEKIYTFNPSTFITTDDIGDIAIKYYNNSANAEVIAEINGRVVKSESNITQNAKEIELKVSKGDVSSQLSVESEQVTISGNRLVVDADNFTLEADGSMECSKANITGGSMDVTGDNYQSKIVVRTEDSSSQTYISPRQLVVSQGSNKFVQLNSDMTSGYYGVMISSGGYATHINPALIEVGKSGSASKYFSSDSSVTYSKARIITEGELQSTTKNGLRVVQGNYGAIFHNNGSECHLLATASGDQYGTWSSLRPFCFSLSTGAVTMGNGLTTTSITASDLIQTSGAMTAVTGLAVGNATHRTAIRFLKCGSVVVTPSGTSTQLFTIETLKSWYSNAAQTRTTVIATNGDATVNSVHIDSTQLNSAGCYATFDRTVSTIMRINYTVICWA